jgi:ATP-dependent protease ClpP protease subunit
MTDPIAEISSAKFGGEEPSATDRPNSSSKFARRSALLLLGGMVAPALARAQEAAPAPVPAAPAPNLAPPSPPPNAMPRPIIPPPSAPAGSGANPLGPIDKNKTYFLFFQQSIDLVTMKTLRNDLVALVEGGVTDITLVVSSSGGLVTPALQMYSLIQALPARIKTHGQGFVQSAANILFLAGRERSADANVKFLFHPSQSQIFGAFSGQQIEDQLHLANDAEEAQAQIYLERTHLPEAEVKRFKRETIVYDTAQALEYGIIQSIGNMQIPGEQKAKLVFVE